VVKYLLARFVLFVLAVTLLGLLRFRAEIALIAGLLISSLLAYLLLPRLRDASTVAIVQRLEARRARRSARRDEDNLVEDAQADEPQREPGRQT